ncbi:hypothetical protein KL918_001892 [Ogataea parapolymorpha]|uniref:Morphogenetic regulator of filamentous growth protein 1 n=1 Tax=Ogataea parapolymorpha (strain ATCC 26012 / BCRC 20466 / JCM 22074 / NRRL Y-7560 / DL-1) TaxID=871575 RepID=W1QCG6_OGAPD|nr:hypothetical protein HPODL_04329 [Ogataea parapolymorpha DL-1]ESW98717.1 hypothetical protein HPODL_04329 [Ogataea parapolymorpha DL-1]KAG7868234.1 hypothetical protein KL918_001892 [Ogataea parapolymorpha]KAG7874146.1 hypothetical protein KL916_001486 [Ogataea parapolymorpha]
MNNGSTNGGSPSRSHPRQQNGQNQQVQYINMGIPSQYGPNQMGTQVSHPPMMSAGADVGLNASSSHPSTPNGLPQGASLAAMQKPLGSTDNKRPQQQTQQQWKQIQGLHNGGISTNTMAAAAASAMMGRPGVMSQQQLSALQQLQATYGHLQNSLYRPMEDQPKPVPGIPMQPGAVKGQARDQNVSYPAQGQAPSTGHGAQMTHSEFNNANDIKKNIANIAIIRLFELTEKLCVRADSENLEYWRRVMEEYFSESAMATLTLKHGNEGRFYTFTFSLFARIIYTIALSGVGFFEISHNLIRANVLPNGSTHLECSRLILRNWYLDGSYVTLYGVTKIQFSRQLKIEKIDISIYRTSAGLELGTIDKFLAKNEFIDSKSIRQNFSAFKGLSNFGLQENVMRVMQVGDVMTLVKPLMHFHALSRSNSPIASLEAFNKSTSNELSALEKMTSQFQQAQLRSQQQAGLKRQKFQQHQFQDPSALMPKSAFTQTNKPAAQRPPSPNRLSKKKLDDVGLNKLDLANSTLNKRRKMVNGPASNSQTPNGQSGAANESAFNNGEVSPKTVESEK